MIVQLLVFTCACALGVTGQGLSYSSYFSDLVQAKQVLQDNVLSIDGNIPLLTDPRRHYTQIINVVNYLGVAQSGCFIPDYFQHYQQNLNESSAHGLNKPQHVIEELQQLIEDVRHKLDPVLALLTSNNKVDAVQLDVAVDNFLQGKSGKYDWRVDVFLAAHTAAVELLALDPTFSKVSQDLNAAQYLMTASEELNNIVQAVGQLHRVLNYKTLQNC